jgi:response regulator RpfG family c-di-GMP phosphodiesterase
MLTGQADLDTAMDAVNKGRVFRFLNKPCDEETLAEVVEAGIRQYELVTSERILLEQTLTGSLQVLVDLLSISDPKLFGRAEEVKRWALDLAEWMGIGHPWDLGIAALLAPIGRMAIPIDLLGRMYRGDRLTIQEQEAFRTIPETGARIVANIPRLKPVSRIILYSTKNFDGEGYPMDEVKGEDLPLESRILRLATDFVEEAQVRQRHSKALVYERFRLTPGKYDPALLRALGQMLGTAAEGEQEVPHRLLGIEELQPGMVLVGDVLSPDGLILLPAGTRLSVLHLERLRSLSLLSRLEEPLLVECPD